MLGVKIELLDYDHQLKRYEMGLVEGNRDHLMVSFNRQFQATTPAPPAPVPDPVPVAGSGPDVAVLAPVNSSSVRSSCFFFSLFCSNLQVLTPALTIAGR